MENIFRGLGFLCLIALPITVMFYLGFREKPEVKDVVNLFPNLQTLLTINTILGILGTLLIFGFNGFIEPILRGLLLTIFLTAFAFLYLSWRETVYNFEFLFMYLPAIPAMLLYNFLEELMLGKKVTENSKN